MKVFLKKMAVIAAAVTILFAFSACDFLNGKGNQDDGSTTTQTDSISTSATATDTTNTATSSDTTSTSTTTTTTTTTGGDSTTTGGDQTVTIVAEFGDLAEYGINFKFYSDNTWKFYGEPNLVTGSGTYTGNSAQDGSLSLTLTKKVPDNSTELQDCTSPETYDLTITDGIFEFEGEDDEGNPKTEYYIRKANEVANYVILNNFGNSYNLLKYIFYDNSTVRFISDETPVLLGTYTGNPCADGNITLIGKYRYYSDRGLEASNSTTALSIVNGCFSGSDTIPAAREIEVFKAVSISEVIPTDSFFKFYADGTFLWTFSVMGVEFPSVYGTYTGNPCSTEANASVIITETHEYCLIAISDPSDDEESSGEWSEIEEGENTKTLQISNNQFPFTTGYNDNEPIIVNFVRQ